MFGRLDDRSSGPRINRVVSQVSVLGFRDRVKVASWCDTLSRQGRSGSMPTCGPHANQIAENTITSLGGQLNFGSTFTHTPHLFVS